MASGLVKWDDRSRNSRGEDGILDPESRSKDQDRTDAELRKHREQKGLETPVVYAVDDVHSFFESPSGISGKRANA